MGNGERGTGTNYETPTPCNSAYKKRLKAENNSVQAFAESTVTTVYLDLFTAVNVYFLLRVLHQETVRNKSNIGISLIILYIIIIIVTLWTDRNCFPVPSLQFFFRFSETTHLLEIEFNPGSVSSVPNRISDFIFDPFEISKSRKLELLIARKLILTAKRM